MAYDNATILGTSNNPMVDTTTIDVSHFGQKVMHMSCPVKTPLMVMLFAYGRHHVFFVILTVFKLFLCQCH